MGIAREALYVHRAWVCKCAASCAWGFPHVVCSLPVGHADFVSFVADQVSMQQDVCDTSPTTCDTLQALGPAVVHLAGGCGLLFLLLLHDWKSLVTRLVHRWL